MTDFVSDLDEEGSGPDGETGEDLIKKRMYLEILKSLWYRFCICILWITVEVNLP